MIIVDIDSPSKLLFHGQQSCCSFLTSTSGRTFHPNGFIKLPPGPLFVNVGSCTNLLFDQKWQESDLGLHNLLIGPNANPGSLFDLSYYTGSPNPAQA